MAILFVLTMFGAVGLLSLAVWPGALEDALLGFPFFCVSVPMLGLWFVLVVALAAGDLVRERGIRAERRWGLWSSAVMFATLALLWWNVPQRIAFACCAAGFREWTDDAPLAEFRGGEELGRWLGPYLVARYAADARGGVYFRTHEGPDGIGPDTMSYGFAYRPNDEGTPFGNAHLRLRHLFGDWYEFAASNDW